jgi:transcriptional regulator with XRE-family HTH domain
MKLIFNGKQFGKALRQKRVMDDDHSLQVLSLKLGVSAPTLSRIENGNTPDVTTYALICRYLDVSMEDFFSEAKTRNKKQ